MRGWACWKWVFEPKNPIVCNESSNNSRESKKEREIDSPKCSVVFFYLWTKNNISWSSKSAFTITVVGENPQVSHHTKTWTEIRLERLMVMIFSNFLSSHIVRVGHRFKIQKHDQTQTRQAQHNTEQHNATQFFCQNALGQNQGPTRVIQKDCTWTLSESVCLLSLFPASTGRTRKVRPRAVADTGFDYIKPSNRSISPVSLDWFLAFFQHFYPTVLNWTKPKPTQRTPRRPKPEKWFSQLDPEGPENRHRPGQNRVADWHHHLPKFKRDGPSGELFSFNSSLDLSWIWFLKI